MSEAEATEVSEASSSSSAEDHRGDDQGEGELLLLEDVEEEEEEGVRPGGVVAVAAVISVCASISEGDSRDGQGCCCPGGLLCVAVVAAAVAGEEDGAPSPFPLLHLRLCCVILPIVITKGGGCHHFLPPLFPFDLLLRSAVCKHLLLQHFQREGEKRPLITRWSLSDQSDNTRSHSPLHAPSEQQSIDLRSSQS